MFIIENYKKIITEKYFNFEGRATRSEFWYFFLANFIINTILGFISEYLVALFSLAILLPYLGVGARRLHDIGKSGYFMLISLIPLVGPIILLILWAKAGNAESNNFGESTQQIEEK